MSKFYDDLLAPAAIKEIRLDLTSRCNLRCVYCHVSQIGYVGMDMALETVKRTVTITRALMRHHDPVMVSVNGGGETTYLDGWERICQGLLDAGAPVGLTTNLSKDYSENELDVLAQIPSIAISIDTSDRTLLRRMRRKVDVRQIIANIALIRATAVRLGRRQPRFTFLSGLYDKNALLVEDLARLAVALNIIRVSFWDLKKYPWERLDAPEQARAVPLRELSDAELANRIRCIDRAIALLERHGVAVNVHAEFVGRLAARVGRDG